MTAPRIARALALAAVPAVGLALASSRSGSGAEALFRGDAAGLALAVAVAAFSTAGARVVLVRIAAVAVLLALAHALAAVALGRPPVGAPPLAILAVGVMGGAAGFASLGRSGGVPDPVVGAIAAAVLWIACGGVWWADDFAERLALEARPAARQAILDLDPFTAAAYGSAGLDRLRLPAVYEGTTIATVGVTRPTPEKTGALWGGFGVVAGAAAFLVRRLRRAPAAS